MTNRMTFENYGRAHHLRIRTVPDLEHILELDEALWVATGAPIASINEDPAFLDYLDIDDNGRILCYEVKRAIRWLLDTLSDHSGIPEKSEILALDTVNMDTKDGERIITAAKKILLQLRESGKPGITIQQVREIKTQHEESNVSLDGMATPASADDEDIRTFITDIIETIGGVPETSDKPENIGITTEKLEEFLEEARARLDWHKHTLIPHGQRNTKLMPLGNNTHSAFQSYLAVRDKIDQYFAQCEAISFDPRIAEIIKPSTESLEPDKVNDLETLRNFMEESPLANPDQQQTLRFSEPLNPFYASALQRFRAEVMMPVLNQSMKNLSKEDWLAIKDTFSVYEEWYNTKKGGRVEKLGLEKLRKYLDDKYHREAGRIIANSKKTALVMDNIYLLEKLILYQSRIVDFVNNFVSFPHLYDPSSRAVFEMGTLIVDGRRLNFSVRVDNLKQHVDIARTSDIFILYADVTLENKKDHYTVAVPVTCGNKGNLCVGKRGIFRDLRDKLLDARVVDIIENPISIGETLVAPFQRLGKLLTGKIEAMTAAAEKKLDTAASSAMAPPQQTQASKGLMAGGLLMGGGVAFAAVTSAVTFFVKTVGSLGAAKTIGGILVTIMAILAPASIIALMKLRRRDLSSILEGVGWAINARMRLTFRQSRVFTETPPLPRKARVIRSAHWLLWLLLIITILLSIAKLSRAEEPEWKRSTAIGLNITSGNSDTSLLNVDLSAERKGSAHELILDSRIAKGETDDETTEENANARAQYNYLVTDRAYLYLNLDYLYDSIALIDYRVTAGPGAGYYFKKDDKCNFSMELGAAYITEKNDLANTVNTAAIDDTEDSINLRAVSRYEYALSETARIWEVFEYLAEFEDFDLYLINYEIGIDAAINSHFTLRLVFEDKYDNNPAPGIEKNDIIVKSALVCNL